MSAAVPIPVIQALQVLTVALGAPWVTGVIARVEARLQGRRGPRVLQPYYDLAKLVRKEALAPERASWFFLAAPVIAVAAYLTIRRTEGQPVLPRAAAAGAGRIPVTVSLVISPCSAVSSSMTEYADDRP